MTRHDADPGPEGQRFAIDDCFRDYLRSRSRSSLVLTSEGLPKGDSLGVCAAAGWIDSGAVSGFGVETDRCARFSALRAARAAIGFAMLRAAVGRSSFCAPGWGGAAVTAAGCASIASGTVGVGFGF